jgi:hypothetical protein
MTKERKPQERFVRLDHELLNSEAYLALTCPARCLLVELFKLYNGKNNGKIAMGMREAAARIHGGKDTAHSRFDELCAKGFIKLAKSGWFSSKGSRASEWTITCADHDGEPATHDYLMWQEGQDFDIPKRKPKPSRWAKRKPKLHVVTTAPAS